MLFTELGTDLESQNWVDNPYSTQPSLNYFLMPEFCGSFFASGLWDHESYWQHLTGNDVHP